GVVQVRKIELVDLLRIHELQQFGQFMGVVLGDGEPQSHLDAALAAQADAAQGGVEGPRAAAEAVVGGARSVDADADVVVADLRNGVDVAAVDERAVGGQPHVKPQRLGAARDVEDVRPQQRLAAGEDQHPYTAGLEVVHHGINLGGG